MYAKFAVTALALILLLPALGYAQEGDLRAAIELAVLSDPHSQSLSQEELSALIDALHADAAAQGMAAEDVTWRPIAEEAPVEEPVCGTLCALTHAFGFDGSTIEIPIMLGASALMLIFLIAALLGYRHFHHLHPEHASGSAAPPQAPGVAL